MLDPDVEAWIEENYATLLRYASYQTFGDPELAMDLLHLTVECICTGQIRLDLTRSPKTYLQWRMRNRQRLLMPLFEIVPNGLSPRPTSANWELLMEVYLPQLTPRQQDVIHGVIQGQTFVEIAHGLGLKRQGIQAHYDRAIQRLRALAQAHAAVGSADGREQP